jgi:hypothetical protein
MAEKNFVKGLWYKLPHERAPKFIIANLSISKDSFGDWLADTPANSKGYINIDIKLSRETNKPYAEVNDYDPSKKPVTRVEQDDMDGAPQIESGDVPF